MSEGLSGQFWVTGDPDVASRGRLVEEGDSSRLTLDAAILPSSARSTIQTVGGQVLQTIEDIARNGNQGIGKPGALKHDFAGYWSRRITDEHRLVYKIVSDEIRIAACRYHYGR